MFSYHPISQSLNCPNICFFHYNNKLKDGDANVKAGREVQNSFYSRTCKIL